MFDLIYMRRLQGDLESWVAKGWVTTETAGMILASARQKDGRLKLPMALAGIGVICIALALAAFIAANWGAIPKAVKLIGIAIGVAGSHMTAAYAARRGKQGIADLATAFATLVFVGGLALIGQIFHLPQDWPGGAFIVCLGGLAAAWIAGSRGSLVVAAIALASWQFSRSEFGGLDAEATLFGGLLTLVILLHPVAYPNWVSRWAALFLCYITFGRWLVDLDLSGRTGELAGVLGLAGFSACLVLGGLALERAVERGLTARLRKDGALLLARTAQEIGIGVLTLGVVISLTNAFDSGPVLLVSVATSLPVIVTVIPAAVLGGLAVYWSGKDLKGLLACGAAGACTLAIALAALLPGQPVLVAAISLAATIAVSAAGITARVPFWTLSGHLGLTAVVLWLLEETIGSLLGQSVFFLVAGVVLLIMALVIVRIFRRTAKSTSEESA